MKQNLLDALFIYCLFYVWLLLLHNIVLCFKGYQYYLEISREANVFIPDSELPSVSILIPAHNEEDVILRTVQAIHNLDYPSEKCQIIVINDCSTDHTAEILEHLKPQVPDLEVVTTYPPQGGHGKSGALNIGLQYAKGQFVVIYDADNTPERMALRYLVTAISQDPKLGAVIGKFRTRNKNDNILTRFINIETLSFQWMAQAGRWKLFRMVTIPGTNFIIHKALIDQLGG